MKTCTKCKIEKPLKDFGNEKRVKDGKQARCKECTKEYYRQNRERFSERRREYVARNDEHIRQRKAKWYSSNRERLRKKSAEYYIANRGLWEKWAEDNRDYRKEYRKQYWAETRDTQLPRLAEYRASNPHLWWEYAYLQRAEKYGFAPDMKSFTKDEIIARWGDACWHCKGPFEELDHAIVPVAHGGEHSLENCRPSCTSCNRSQYIRTHNKNDIGETA